MACLIKLYTKSLKKQTIIVIINFMDIEKRFYELAARADERCYTTFSDFLNMEEQSKLNKMKLNIPYTLFGGYDMAERCIAGFGYESNEAVFPIAIVKAEPAMQKFADKLSHRDILGSLMGLGIKREVIGDIIISSNTGYIFCLESIAEYICRNLGKIRHTSVKCTVADKLPDAIGDNAKEKEIIVASIRLDTVIAGVYNLSRNAVKEYFTNRKIFVNSTLCENFSYNLKDSDIISVRGKGRFIFIGILGNTKKNRSIIKINLYE